MGFNLTNNRETKHTSIKQHFKTQDDSVLCSYTKPSLQILLNKSHTQCNEWGATVNTDKTVYMVFKKCNRVEQCDMFCNNTRLTDVQKFTYFGCNSQFYRFVLSSAENSS